MVLNNLLRPSGYPIEIFFSILLDAIPKLQREIRLVFLDPQVKKKAF
jgi:hypothetical protein